MPLPFLAVLRRDAAAFCALLVGVLLTVLATAYVHHGVRERERRRFENAVRDGTRSLQQRMDTYLAMLLGARGLFASSTTVDRFEFHRYVESLDLRRAYPGIQGLGYTQWLGGPRERERLVASLHAEGFRSFHLWPEGGHSAIVFLEPFDAPNRAAFGFDMFSEPTRRVAMARARDTGLPAVSGRVRLVQEAAIQGPPQPGVLIYVPVYERRQMPSTPAERRRELRGFVYAPFRLGDLVGGLRFPGFQSGTVGLEIYDGLQVDEAAALYHSEAGTRSPEGLSQVLTVHVAGQPWTLRFTERAGFVEANDRLQSRAVLGGGLGLTLLLFLVIRAQARARVAAEAASAVQHQLATEARTAARLRDDFLGIAAHELRTPLTALKLQLQLLQRELGPESSGRSRLARGVATCERQTTRLSELVNSLLDVSRLTGGRLELNLEPLDLGALAREVVERFETEAWDKGVSLSIREEPGVVGRWDGMRLEQVLTNLVSNALKYGRGAPVEVRVRADGTHARVEVEDRGIGISPEDAPRIFGRFERAVPSRHYGGLGLGLYITRQLVEAHGGHVSVDSTPGHGSTFTVTLPLEEPASEVPCARFPVAAEPVPLLH